MTTEKLILFFFIFSSDVFKQLRNELDTGYTAIGNYQDLNNVDYTEEVHDDKLQIVLEVIRIIQKINT